MPASTSTPMAMAMPLSDMMFEVMPNCLHQDERNQDRDRQRQRHDQDAAEVPEEDDVGQRHEDDFLDQRVLQRGDRALDQLLRS